MRRIARRAAFRPVLCAAEDVDAARKGTGRKERGKGGQRDSHSEPRNNRPRAARRGSLCRSAPSNVPDSNDAGNPQTFLTSHSAQSRMRMKYRDGIDRGALLLSAARRSAAPPPCCCCALLCFSAFPVSRAPLVVVLCAVLCSPLSLCRMRLRWPRRLRRSLRHRTRDTSNSAVFSRSTTERGRRADSDTPLVRKAWQTLTQTRSAEPAVAQQRGEKQEPAHPCHLLADAEAAIGGARHQRSRAQHTARGTADRRWKRPRRHQTTGRAHMHGRHRSEHRCRHTAGLTIPRMVSGVAAEQRRPLSHATRCQTLVHSHAWPDRTVCSEFHSYFGCEAVLSVEARMERRHAFYTRSLSAVSLLAGILCALLAPAAADILSPYIIPSRGDSITVLTTRSAGIGA